ncbi:MAG TPA: sulfatase-like hydrolase/transferase, partial [Candidatus Polarisedimenticolia bacterium]|nr:sulfatase-like hydrolase/transferase [Candidatus Polarisedimenticolia bacterium]
DIMGGSRADYHRNVLHLDTVVGRIVDRLRRAGRFDKSLVIMTSDHSWRTDPDIPRTLEPERVRHVPLLIKVPGQNERRTIDAPFDDRSLGSIIEAALDGRLDTRAADRLIPEAEDSGMVTAGGGAAPERAASGPATSGERRGAGGR